MPRCFRSNVTTTSMDTASSSGGGITGLLRSLSPEQLSVAAAPLTPASVLVVKAFAGSGKTTTLRAMACSRPDKKFLYLAFNVTVRDDAGASFPPNVSADHPPARVRVRRAAVREPRRRNQGPRRCRGTSGRGVRVARRRVGVGGGGRVRGEKGENQR